MNTSNACLPEALCHMAAEARVHNLPGAWIGGQPVPGEGAVFPLHAPATGAAIGALRGASEAQVHAAVQAARQALPGWSHTPRQQRGACLQRVADALARHRPALVELLQWSNGKPAAEADIDLSDAEATYRYYADLCQHWDRFEEEAVAVPDGSLQAQRRYLPVGVAALILPWNFPLVTAAWKLAPALAAGCTVVVKPSEAAPLPEQALAALLADAGLPAGVVSCVFGGAEVGRALVAHAGIDKVSFTGSTAVGRGVMRAASEHFTRIGLELGGKSSLIVCPSAALEPAVESAAAGIFSNAGQMCSATSRVLVHRALYADFLQRFAERAARWQPVVCAARGQTAYGPLISAAHRERVLAAIQTGRRDGVRLLAGGGVPAQAPGGFFVEPTVFADVPTEHPLWQDEIFGPVACVRPFDHEDEAVALANDTPYGLAATVLGDDAAQVDRLAHRLRAGMVWKNQPQLVFPDLGWGGFGSSGIGRELGVPGLRAYQEMQHTLGAGPVAGAR